MPKQEKATKKLPSSRRTSKKSSTNKTSAASLQTGLSVLIRSRAEAIENRNKRKISQKNSSAAKKIKKSNGWMYGREAVSPEKMAIEGDFSVSPRTNNMILKEIKKINSRIQLVIIYDEEGNICTPNTKTKLKKKCSFGSFTIYTNEEISSISSNKKLHSTATILTTLVNPNKKEADKIKEKDDVDNKVTEQKIDNVNVLTAVYSFTYNMIKQQPKIRNPSQNTVMGMSANEAAKYLNLNTKIKYEWGHLIPYFLGGSDSQVKCNFVLMTKNCNTQMMFIENELTIFAKQLQELKLTGGIELTVKAELIPNDKNIPFAKKIFYQIKILDLNLSYDLVFDTCSDYQPPRTFQKLFTAIRLGVIERAVLEIKDNKDSLSKPAHKAKQFDKIFGKDLAEERPNAPTAKRSLRLLFELEKTPDKSSEKVPEQILEKTEKIDHNAGALCRLV